MGDLSKRIEMEKYNKDYAQHFGNNVRMLRKQRGLSLRQLGRAVGVAHGTIYRYESGGSMPDMLAALLLADFFGVTLDELIRPKE